MANGQPFTFEQQFTIPLAIAAFPASSNGQISEAKQLLQIAANDLKTIESELRTAVNGATSPSQSTCEAVNKTRNDINNIINMVTAIEIKNKSQENDINNLKVDIYNLNKKIDEYKDEIENLKKEVAELKSGSMLRHFLYSLETRIFLRFYPSYDTESRKREYKLKLFDRKIKNNAEQKEVLQKFLDRINFNRKDTPEMIDELLDAYRNCLDGAAHPESQLTNYLSDMTNFKKMLDDFGVDDVYREEFEKLGKMYFDIQNEPAISFEV